MRGLIKIGLLFLLIALASGCCTRELALSVGDAARESFFREQDRLQQRFLQIEADAIKDTVATVRDVLRDKKTREAVKQLADDFTQATDKSIEATAARFETTLKRMDTQLTKTVSSVSAVLRTEQEKLTDTTVKTLRKFSNEAGTAIRTTVTDSLRETRRVLAEEELLSQEARAKIKTTVQPLINEIIQESGRTSRDTMQENIDQLQYPLAIGAVAILAFALVTMVLPSMFLFMSYKRSIAALDAIKEIAEALRDRADNDKRSGAGTEELS